jgi:hypothetical protein
MTDPATVAAFGGLQVRRGAFFFAWRAHPRSPFQANEQK